MAKFSTEGAGRTTGNGFTTVSPGQGGSITYDGRPDAPVKFAPITLGGASRLEWVAPGKDILDTYFGRGWPLLLPSVASYGDVTLPRIALVGSRAATVRLTAPRPPLLPDRTYRLVQTADYDRWGTFTTTTRIYDDQGDLVSERTEQPAPHIDTTLVPPQPTTPPAPTPDTTEESE